MSDIASTTRRLKPTKKQVVVGSVSVITICLITSAVALAIGLKGIDRALKEIK
jgi:hypothetical protein